MHQGKEGIVGEGLIVAMQFWGKGGKVRGKVREDGEGVLRTGYSNTDRQGNSARVIPTLTKLCRRYSNVQ